MVDAAGMQSDLVIVGGARTAMAEYSGTPGFGKFKDVSALDLGAHATRHINGWVPQFKALRL